MDHRTSATLSWRTPMLRPHLPLIPVLEDTVLPGEDRPVAAQIFAEGAVRWLQDLAPGSTYILLAVTAFAEVPLLASGRYATRVTHLGLDGDRPRIHGEARVRLGAVKGARAPFDAEYDPAPETAPSRLPELVLHAVTALRHGPP